MRGSRPAHAISRATRRRAHRTGCSRRTPPPPRAPRGVPPRSAGAAELIADLDVIARSLASHGAAALAAGRLAPLRRAVEIFGFHLAVLDLRQNSDVHEVVVGELLARAGVVVDYASLDEPARVALLSA